MKFIFKVTSDINKLSKEDFNRVRQLFCNTEMLVNIICPTIRVHLEEE